MGQMVGADVGDLERAGGELASFGKQISGMQRPLRAQLYSTPWKGRAADRFRSDWDRIHGPALSAAGEFLREAGSGLRNQARQQADASHSASGQARSEQARAMLERFSGGSWGLSSWVLGGVMGGISLIDSLDGVARAVGMNRAGSGVRRVLGVSGRFVHRQLGPIAGKIGLPLRIISGGYSMSLAGGDLYQAIRSGDSGLAWASGSNFVQAGLKTYPNPVSYLIGANAGLYTEVAKAATSDSIDWSWGGVSDVVTASPVEWGKAIWEVRGDIGSSIWKAFT